MPTSTVTEVVFFRVRPEIKPEAPETNQDSYNLLWLLRDTKQQHGHMGSAWGRTVEDEDVIVWVLAWADARGTSRSVLLQPYLAPTTEVLTLFTTLTPAVDIGTLCGNPVTELCPLTFPTSLTPDKHNEVNEALIKLRSEMLENIQVSDGEEAKKVRPRNWSMGHVDRPGTRSHPTSPSGEAFVVFLFIGWESVDAHLRARETEQFLENMKPLREMMLPTGAGLLPGSGWGMSHAIFREP
ncbi:hypothetical protein PHISP_03980 [Aspergillus sp. HF37]|nr:hypothetical protein PHISP_03980 [Aspergillus sp. HF37]